MRNTVLEFGGKRINVSVQRETWELTDHEMDMIFCKIQEFVESGLIVEDSENQGRYDLNLEALDELRDFAVEFFDFQPDLSEWFWQSFTVSVFDAE
jgi:hypothetical protein